MSKQKIVFYLIVSFSIAILAGHSRLSCQQKLYFYFDDFDRYQRGTFPTSEWAAYFNATASGNGVYYTWTKKVSGKSLKLHGSSGGCWEATAAKKIPYMKKMVIKVKLMREDIEPGCHERGCLVGLSDEMTSTGAHGVNLVSLYDDGEIRAFGTYKIGEWSLYRWYNITINVNYPNYATFRVNGWWRGRFDFPSSFDPYKYLNLNSGNGDSWFDDIFIEAQTK